MTQRTKLPPGMRYLPSGNIRWEKMVDGRRFSGTARNITEARNAQSLIVADAQRGGLVDPSAVTVNEYLTQWLEGKKKTRSTRSGELQAGLLKRYISEPLGDIRLQKLTPSHLLRLFAGLTARNLGASTQRQVHQFLHHALGDALRAELVPRNVADLVRPTPPKQEDDGALDAYTPEEAAAFLAACRADHRGAVFEFALGTGMRRGEFCGLRWIDIDWEKGTAQVQETVSDASGKARTGSPKTAGSRRTVYLSQSLLALLASEQGRQAELRVIHGPKWQESGRVFVNSLGGTLLPNNLKRDMQRIYTAAGVRHLHIHGLRDTYASLAARQGVPIEVISKQLGHASVAFTLNVYRTVFQDERKRWALNVDDLTKDPAENPITHELRTRPSDDDGDK